MNPVSGMLAEAKLAAAVVPTLLRVGGNVVHNLPDIETQFGKLVSGLQKAWDDAKHLDVNSAKADLGAAWAAGMKIYDDVGLPRETVSSVVASAAKDMPALSGLQSAFAAAEKVGRQLGLPV